VTVEVFVDYRSFDLISAKLGETDFIVHSKPAATREDSTTGVLPQEDEEEADSQSARAKRANSDEEDKGLITEELLKTPSIDTTTIMKAAAPADLDADEEERLMAQSVPQAVTTLHLEDVLILKIENGRDYFLTVTAEFSPTAEGQLVLVPSLTS
jgi:hypothetical protein